MMARCSLGMETKPDEPEVLQTTNQKLKNQDPKGAQGVT